MDQEGAIDDSDDDDFEFNVKGTGKDQLRFQALESNLVLNIESE